MISGKIDEVVLFDSISNRQTLDFLPCPFNHKSSLSFLQLTYTRSKAESNHVYAVRNELLKSHLSLTRI